MKHTIKTLEFAVRVKAPLVVLHVGSIEMKNYTDKLLEMAGRGERESVKYRKLSAEFDEKQKAKKDKFARCLSEKLLIYALGRGLEAYDKCSVDTIVNQTKKNDYHFSALVTAVVQSDPFRKRRGDGGHG